jgi:hypothetical protein
VAHLSRLFKVVIDVPASDHDRELVFWEAATGQPLSRFDYPNAHGAALHGQDFWLLMQRLGEGTARVHVDIHADDLAAEVDRPTLMMGWRLSFSFRLICPAVGVVRGVDASAGGDAARW